MWSVNQQVVDWLGANLHEYQALVLCNGKCWSNIMMDKKWYH